MNKKRTPQKTTQINLSINDPFKCVCFFFFAQVMAEENEFRDR